MLQKQISFINFFILLAAWLIVLGCTEKKQSNEQHEQISESELEEDLSKEKTTIYRKESHLYFDLLISKNEDPFHYSFEGYNLSVRLKNDNLHFSLCDIQSVYCDASIIHLYDAYYFFPYWSGGNYSRASGYHLLKIDLDTALYIGLCNGYEDIDGDGEKEFYYNVVESFGEGNAFNTIGKYEAILKNDSLTYPGLLEGF